MSDTSRYDDKVRILMRGNTDRTPGRYPYEVLAPHQREYRASWHEEEWRSGRVIIGNPRNGPDKIPVTLTDTEEQGFLHYRICGALGSDAIELLFEPADKLGYFTTFYDGFVDSKLFFDTNSPFRITEFQVVIDNAQYRCRGTPKDVLLVIDNREVLYGSGRSHTILLVAPTVGEHYALKAESGIALEFKPALFRKQGWPFHHPLYGQGWIRFEPDDLYTSFKLMFYPDYDKENPKRLDHLLIHPTEEGGKYPAWVSHLHSTGAPLANLQYS